MQARQKRGGCRQYLMRGRRSRPHGAVANAAPDPMTVMPSKPKTNRATRTLLFTQILKAITQYINATIVLRGQSLTPQALAASFTAALQADTDLDAAEAVVKDKRLA